MTTTPIHRKLREFAGDDRAQAIGISQLFLGLLVGVVVVGIVGKVTEPLFEKANAAGSGEVASNGTTWLQQGVDFLPIVFLLIGFFGLIAYSVWSREAVR